MHDHAYKAGVSLRRLFPESVTLYAGDIRVTACTSDARGVRPGDTFIALDTAEADGHDFVSDAIERGAEAVIVERPVPQTRVPMCLVPDTRQAYSRLCQALAGDPSQSVSCIGVTGTDGKTTAARLVRSVLRAGGAAAHILDDLSLERSRQAGAVGGGVRSAPELAVALGEMAASQASHAVVEVSSRALSEHVLSGMQLDAACFTNLTRAHLDLHNSVASYRRIKARLIEHLRPGGICILNRDDPITARIASYAPGPVLTYGMHGPADVTAEVVDRHPSEQSFLLTVREQTAVVRTRVVGEHHVHNCLLAASVGLAAGCDLATIARGLEALEGLPGRLERISLGNAPQFYLDIAATPTALAAALMAVRCTASGRVWCVADVPASGDGDELARFGHAAAHLADAVFFTESPAHTHDHLPSDLDRLSLVVAGLESRSHVVVSRNRTHAIQATIHAAKLDDVVLIVGSPRQLGSDRQAIRQAWKAASGAQPGPLCSHPAA